MGMTSVDGLVSGLDTTSIVNQLMALERRPVENLTARKATYDARVTAWDQIGAKIAALRTALEALDTASDLKSFKATSSNTNVLTVSAGSSAVPGPISFVVKELASAQQLMSKSFASPSAEVSATAATATITSGLARINAGVNVTGTVANGSHTITVSQKADTTWQASLDGGTAVAITPPGVGETNHTVSFTVGTGSLEFDFAGAPTAGTASVAVANVAAHGTLADLASAISTAGGPARAQVVDFGGGQGARLILTATNTGTDNGVELLWTDGDNSRTSPSPLVAAMAELKPAQNAAIEIPGIDGTTATRQTNTISDLVPGVTLNLVKKDDNPVTVTVTQDVDGAVSKVQALVTSLNGVVSGIKSAIGYDAATKKAGALLGDSTARSLQSSLATATGTLLETGTYKLFSQLGLSLTKDGTYTLDESKLRAALGSDYDNTGTAINSLVGEVLDWAKDNDATTGTVSRAKGGAKSTSTDLQKQIDGYDVRLAATEARFRKQFTALEAALGQLKSQSSWLAGQIASLPGFDT